MRQLTPAELHVLCTLARADPNVGLNTVDIEHAIQPEPLLEAWGFLNEHRLVAPLYRPDGRPNGQFTITAAGMAKAQRDATDCLHVVEREITHYEELRDHPRATSREREANERHVQHRRNLATLFRHWIDFVADLNLADPHTSQPDAPHVRLRFRPEDLDAHRLGEDDSIDRLEEEIATAQAARDPGTSPPATRPPRVRPRETGSTDPSAPARPE